MWTVAQTFSEFSQAWHGALLDKISQPINTLSLNRNELYIDIPAKNRQWETPAKEKLKSDQSLHQPNCYWQLLSSETVLVY